MLEVRKWNRWELMGRMEILEALQLGEEIQLRSAFNTGSSYSGATSKHIEKLLGIRDAILFPPTPEADEAYRQESIERGKAGWARLKEMFGIG